MRQCLDIPATRSVPAPTLARMAGRLWRRLTRRQRLDPDLMSTHMLRDLGLPDRIAEDPLAIERVRLFF